MTKPNMPLADRFELYVKRDGPIIRPDIGPCQIWIGAANELGYGRFGIDGRTYQAHRVAFLIEHGRWPFPFGLHRCDHPPCVKVRADERGPAHIFEGTSADNVADMVAKGRHATQFRTGFMPAGETHPRAQLTTEQVLSMRARWAKGDIGMKALAALFNVTTSAAYCVVTRRSWRHV